MSVSAALFGNLILFEFEGRLREIAEHDVDVEWKNSQYFFASFTDSIYSFSIISIISTACKHILFIWG